MDIFIFSFPASMYTTEEIALNGSIHIVWILFMVSLTN